MYRNRARQIWQVLTTVIEGVKYAAFRDGADAAPVARDCAETFDIIVQIIRAELPEPHLSKIDDLLLQAESYMAQMLGACEKSRDVGACAAAAEQGLEALKNAFERSEGIHYQVAFMPYNAGMWDAMETVWRAACEDSACEVYVVPLPYCERKPDGSMGDVRYDGSMLPRYVPVTHYGDYDLEERHPDVIYIHNVYDGQNRVSCVLPQYHTGELKRHTDLLVYLPYYVSTGGVSEGFYSITTLANVDMVVAETEGETDRFDRHWPKGKAVAFGSLKAERVVMMEEFPPDIPQDWLEKIRGKTVILYATSISTALVSGHAYIQKTKEALDFFASRDDLVALWRPHPLLKSTFKSMRPQLLEQYAELERRFLASGKGIYNDTADAHAALYVSDAYYGDPSSLVFTYGITGKPIMYQTPGISGDGGAASCAGILPVGDIAYTTALTHNALLRVDMSADRAQSVGAFPGEDGADLYADLAMSGESVVCAPRRAREIGVYDAKDGGFRTCPIPPARTPYHAMNKFAFAVAYGRYVYLAGACYPGLVRFDTASGEARRLDKWRKTDPAFMEFFARNPTYPCFDKSYCVSGETLYAPCLYYPGVLEFNMRTGEGRVIRAGAEGIGYCAAARSGEYLWLFPTQHTQALRYRLNGGGFDTFAYPADAFSGKYGPANFSHAFVQGGCIWLFPYNCEAPLVRIDPASGGMQAVAPRWEGKSVSSYLSFAPEGDGLAALTNGGELLRIDFEGGEPRIEATRLTLDGEEDIARGAWDAHFTQTHALHTPFAYPATEKPSVFTLSGFVDALPGLRKHRAVQAEDFRAFFAGADGTCGKRVHRYVTERLDGM